MGLKDVRQAANVRLATLLPDYKELSNVFDIDDNSPRLLEKGYCVRWGRTLTGEGPLRNVPLEGVLEVVLTNSMAKRSTDKIALDVDDLYSEIDTIIADFFNATYLGVPEKMRGIQNVSVSDPVLIHGKKFVEINVTFTIDFLLPISY